MKPGWQFDYSPPDGVSGATPSGTDWVVATRVALPTAALVAALQRFEATALPLITRAPLFWYRIETVQPTAQREVEGALTAEDVPFRYVTPADAEDPRLAPELGADTVPAANARDWQPRGPRTHDEHRTEHRWFLDEESGIAAVRAVCGTGAGTRLAIIDDETRDVDALDLDAMFVVGEHLPSSSASHGAAMVAWACGTRGRPETGVPAFPGVAPDASPRLYVMPKPGRGVCWLPLAIARAALDGADVVHCASYVEGTTSPLLDDALSVASTFGRGGKGTVVVMPTGREISSAPGSKSASLTLRALEPASDPRVLCVSPSGREGGWFLWKDRRGALRPFANRGPNVRCSAPGDDIAHAFSRRSRFGHAESSGASAIVAGVCALVLGQNPELRASEVCELLARTAGHGPTRADAPLADPADLLPRLPDEDGHDPKCGYGRVSAARACLTALDPVCAALVSMGHEGAARRYLATIEPGSRPYSPDLARAGAQLALFEPTFRHMCITLVRHLRLLRGRRDWHVRHGCGTLARSLLLLVRQMDSEARDLPKHLEDELALLKRRLSDVLSSSAACERLESEVLAVWNDVLAPEHSETTGKQAPMASDTVSA